MTGSRGLLLLLAVGGSALLALVAAASAPGAVRERVRVSIPDPGQLSAVRMQFEVEGDKSPKLRVRLKNAHDLPDEVIGAAQMTRSTERKGRAVALVSFGNVAPAAVRRTTPRVIAQQGVLEVSSAETGTKISDIEFQNVAGSRNFASILGLEPGSERRQAQETFGISGRQIPDDPLGRFDLSAGLKVMDLHAVQEVKVVTRGTFDEDVRELFRDQAIASAIAGAIGPPAVLDAELVSLVTGTPPPLVLDSAFGPSPSNPRLYFVRVQLSVPVMGAQISQASDIDLLDGPEARCQNGLFNDGLVTRGVGPRLEVGLSYRLDCDLPEDHPTVFFDVPMEEAPPPDAEVFKFMPFPYYGSMDIGEAVGGEQTTVLFRGF